MISAAKDDAANWQRFSDGKQIHGITEELTSIFDQANVLQNRAEKIVSVMTAVISIEEAKRAYSQSQNVSRLTYLAYVFVPLSFISSFFSMSSDIAGLKGTFWMFFAVATPLTAMSLLLVRYYASIMTVLGSRKIHENSV